MQGAEHAKIAPLPQVKGTAESLMSYSGFMEPLHPIVDPVNASIEPELVKAIQSWSDRKEMDDFSELEKFVKKQPDSVWTPSLQYNLGKLYYATGFFSRAIDSYEAAWKACGSSSNAYAIMLGNQAAAELAVMYARVGRKAELQALLDDVKGRFFTDDARVQLQRAHEGLSLMKDEPGVSFRCGPYALSNVCMAMKGSVPQNFLESSFSTEKGFSLSEVAEMSAQKLQMPVKMIKLNAGASIPVPSVMHLRCGHYGALLREENGYYLLKDPTFGNDTWMSRKAVLEEGSGYFVTPVQKLNQGHSSVSPDEGKSIFGKGHSGNSDLGCTTGGDGKSGGCPPKKGMAGYTFHTMRASLSVSDTPILISAPYGPSAGLTVTYNQREAYQPATKLFTHFSPQWVSSLTSYLEDNPSNLSADIRVYLSGGGSEVNTGYTSTGTNQGTFTRNRLSGTQLVRTGAGQYSRLNQDGSKLVYDLAVGTTGPARKVFLTKMIDAWGNTMTLNYNGSMPGRIESVTDAAGQSLYFFYENTSDAYLVTKVADGPTYATAYRKTLFTYAVQAGKTRLISITDPVGIVSAFNYDVTGFIDKLTTPYAITTFATGEPVSNGLFRWVESTDAYGNKEHLEYRSDVSSAIVPFGPIPSGQDLTTSTYDWGDRNTVYWDKKAWSNAPNDFTQAQIFHWLQVDNADVASGVLEREKKALSNHVWYNYPGQTLGSYNLGSNSSPSIIARAMEGPDGVTTTQLQRNEYHSSSGNLIRTVDPDGHEVKFNYDATGYDVLSVQFKDGANWITVMTASNYLNHQPQTVTDATGAVTTYTYNSKGQISQIVTTAGTETLTSKAFFDLNGDGTADEAGFPLRSETNSASNPAVMVTTGLMTLDAAKRPRTVTDAQGYTVTYDYDALDRLTQVTHPDATTEQYLYVQDGKTLLQPTAVKDRAGRWSRVVYNALGQMIMRIDPAFRTTIYQWCKCGALSKLTDPMGKVTFWKRDIEGRVTNKFLSDGKEYRYTYQPLSGRLDTVAFPKDAVLNQTTYSMKYALSGTTIKTDYTDAAMADVTLAYTDPLGRLTSVTDGLGTHTNTYYAFGTGGNSGKLSIVNGPLTHDRFSYAYDVLGRGVSSQLLKDDNSVQTSSSVTFDGMGRALTLINNLGTFTSSYGATNFTGMPDSVSLPGGFNTAFTRYAANAGANALRLQTMDHRQGASTVQKHDYAYNLTGNITNWSRTNATANVKAWAMKHDAVDQLSELEESLDSVVQKNESWHYDAAGNIASTMVQPAGQSGVLQIRTNTGRNQLTQLGGTGKTMVEGTTDEPSTVTVNGQPAKATADSATGPFRFYKEMDFGPGSNTFSVVATDGANKINTKNYSVTVSATADQTLEYDANGNTTKVHAGTITGPVTRLMEWDAINQLKAVQSAEVLVAGVKRTEFTYDGMGRRVRQIEKEHNGTTWVTQSDWQYLWEGMGLAQKRHTSTGTVLVNYFGGGETIGNDAIIYLPDHLGSVRDWYRVSDGAKGSAEYSAYGERTITSAGPGAPERGYTGHLHHAANGLILAPFRAYDAQLGRWLSEDPIQESGGPNLYAYVGNGPTGAIDPLGLDKLYLWGPNIRDPNNLNYFKAHAAGQARADNHYPTVVSRDGQLEVSSTREVAHVMPGRTTEEVAQALASVQNITKLVWIGHSSDFGKIDLAQVPTGNVKDIATIHIFGCGTGSGCGPCGGANSAQRAANHFQRPAQGIVRGLSLGLPVETRVGTIDLAPGNMREKESITYSKTQWFLPIRAK